MNEFFKIRTKTGQKDFKVRKFTKWPEKTRKNGPNAQKPRPPQTHPPPPPPQLDDKQL